MKKIILTILFSTLLISASTKANYTSKKLKPGTISSSQIIDKNSKPQTLSGTSANGGNGMYTYQWEKSVDGKMWEKITDATKETYSPLSINKNTYFRRIVSDKINTAYSNKITISIRQP